MGHYDKQIEEHDQRNRELNRQREKNCMHSWKPVACDETGRTTEMQCTNCHKRTILG